MRQKSLFVTKMRDKGTARDIRKQLNDYLISLNEAEKAVFDWETRVDEYASQINEKNE